MNRLKLLRTSRRMTQADLAKAFHVSQSTIAMWETGKRSIDAETITSVADYFNVSTDYLLGKSDDPTPPGMGPLTIDTIEYALYGEARELDEDEKKKLLELAQLMREKRARYEKKE